MTKIRPKQSQRSLSLLPLLAAGAAALVLGTTALVGCGSDLLAGEIGLIRYSTNVRGAAPVSVLPPMSDRDGNVYLIFGGPSLLEAALFVGHAGGGWTSSCTVHEGTGFGVHGFVGRNQDNVWYWSGDALARANGTHGGCQRILATDPSSGARLAFRAVIPWVLDTPSQTATVALIQSPTDPRPFQAKIDLRNNVYTSLERFEPRDATDVEVLGVGGDVGDAEGLVIVRFQQNGGTRTEAQFIDRNGETTDRAGLGGLETLPTYGIVGYLHRNDSGLYAGLDVEGQLLLVDRSGGNRRAVNGMEPVGVQKWDDQLYVVGVNANRPVVAAIDDDGSIGKIRVWDASLEAAGNMSGTLDVIDDRSLPSRNTSWNARNGIGVFPFVHPHAPQRYADGTTTWVVAGPSFSAGGEDRTAIGFTPVGIEYP